MTISNANAKWVGTLKAGKGLMKPANGGEVQFAFGTRFEDAKGSNPEEMIGAALAGCFSMALSAALERNGMTPESIETKAQVHLEKKEAGFTIVRIDLATDVRASGGDQAKLETVAAETKKGCPVSRALGGAVEITAKARLVS